MIFEFCNALVTLWEDHLGEARLAAYLVAKGETAPTSDEIRRHLAESLPSYMIPEYIVLLDALPLTPSGKRDRHALPPPVDAWKPSVSSTQSEDPIYRQIAQIWEDLLDKRPIGFGEHFWDIGGHSLLAARMMDQVAALCGRALPLSLIYETGTVKSLVEAIRDQTPTQRSSYAALSVGGKRRPFFFLHGFHPLGGFYSCHIARHMPPEQPFYAIHPPGRCREALSIERMAADARKTLQSIQPEGPYRIGGFCGSALVAYEMAQQWRAEGQEVELLALVEVHRVNTRLRLILRRLLGTSVRFLTWHRRLLPIYSILRGLRHYWQTRGWTQERRWIYRLMEVCDYATGAYTPLPYDGPLTVLYAKDDPEKFPGNPFDLWKEIAPQLSLCPVPGDHRTCVLADVSGLAEGLRACLETIEENKSSPSLLSSEDAIYRATAP